MVENTFMEICKAYRLPGEYVGHFKLKRGHINESFRVDLNEDGLEKSYLFQRLNHFVFKNPELIMKNLQDVTAHIRRKLAESGETDIKRKVLKPYEHDGEYLYLTEDGQYWRVMSFIYDAATYDDFDLKRLAAIGRGFGRFLALLSDFPCESLHETIPNFHNTPVRFDTFFKAYRDDINGRAADMVEEAHFLESVRLYADRFEKLYRDGQICQRVTHNDTKGNNIMIDLATEEPLAVVDLDTVMPGYAMNDFGDAVRYAANSAAEDEPDISKVSLDLERYEALADGFLMPMRGKFTPKEMENMPWGVLLMTLEVAVRFLSDYLDGDRYFKTAYDRHNLVRGRSQLALAKDILRKFEQMEKITEKYL